MFNLPKRYNKNEECTCPKCGGSDCECYDNDFDDGYMIRKMACNDCDHQWREYFKVIYDGFSDETGEYDANGECVAEYEINEDDDAYLMTGNLRDEDSDDENEDDE